MALPPVFGLELELHAVLMTFHQQGTNNFAPTTMKRLAYSPLLVPQAYLPAQPFYQPGSDAINWKGGWGFRGQGDNFPQRFPDQPQSTCNGVPVHPNQGNAFILELGTAARPADNFSYVCKHSRYSWDENLLTLLVV